MSFSEAELRKKKKRKRHKDKRDSRHMRSVTLSKKNDLELEQFKKLQNDLMKAVNYAKSLFEQLKVVEEERDQLKEEYQSIGEKYMEMEEHLRASLERLQLVERVNEEMELEISEQKERGYLTEVEREELEKREEEVKKIKLENERNAFKLEQFRKDLDEMQEKYLKRKGEKKELEKRVEMLEQFIENHNEGLKMKELMGEELENLKQFSADQRMKKERELDIALRQVKKLKEKERKIKREFWLRQNIIKGKLDTRVEDCRIGLNLISKDFKRQHKDFQNEFVYQMNVLLSKLNELEVEVQEKDLQLEKVIRHEEEVKVIHEREKGVDEEKLMNWMVHFLEHGVKGRAFTQEAFGDGFLFCELVSKFNPKWLNLERENIIMQDEGEEQEQERNNYCGLAFNLIEKYLDVESPLDETCSNEESISTYVNDIHLKMQEFAERRKRSFAKRVIEIRKFFDREQHSFERIRNENDIHQLVEKKKHIHREIVKLNLEYKSLLKFLDDDEEEEPKRELKEFYQGENLSGRMYDFNIELVNNRTKIKKHSDSQKEEKSNTLSKYNELACEYFEWSKKVQETFLQKDTETQFEASKMYADYEDDEKTLFDKNVELNKNAEFTKKIWKYYDNVNFEDITTKEDVFFSKSDIELENDMLTYSLRGMMTNRIKELKKFSFEK